MLRERGLRLTPQRQLILEAVHELGHATPEQVHTAVRERVAGVNITTVYRTLELLEELRPGQPHPPVARLADLPRRG